MKKKLIAILVTIVALICMCAVASAESVSVNPLKVSMELSSNSFTEPKSITVSIQVTNVGESDMPGAVTLYYPNGSKVEAFGSPVLSVGQSQSWSGTLKVTQTMLEAGKITFKIKYSIYNDNGELVNQSKSFSKKITYTGAVTTMEVNRTITPTTAKKGQEVTVTYDIVNTGTVKDSKITIKENSSISSKSVTIDDIEPGEKATYSFKVTMGTKDLTSKPTVTYTAGGKSQTVQLEAATIKHGEVYLTGTLAANIKGANAGELAKLTLTLKNTGKTDVTGISVTDALLGEVFTNQTVKAGETVKLEKSFTIDETHDYQFKVKGVDSNGLDIAFSTDKVTVKALDPAQAILLNVTCEADRQTVYQLPGTVKFRVSVTNNSAIAVTNVKVYAVDTLLYTFPTIEAGKTKEFTRDVDISMAGTFAFNARTLNQLNETVTFNSNTVYINYSRPTAVPTEAPLATPIRPDHVPIPTAEGMSEQQQTTYNVLQVLHWVFGCLCAVSVLLAALGTIRRGQKNAQHKKALASLENESSKRNYEQPADKTNTDNFPDADPADAIEPVDTDAVETAAQGDVMQETLNRIYADRPQTEVKVEEGEEVRRRRRSTEE